MPSETNTVVIYGLNTNDFVVESPRLQAVAAQGGALQRWITLRSLKRILAVYASSSAAAQAQTALNNALGSSLEARSVRVGRGVENVDLSTLDHMSYLQLPDRGRLLFVSPPPSPPNEWDGEGQPEESPNRKTHMTEEFDQALTEALVEAQASQIRDPPRKSHIQTPETCHSEFEATGAQPASPTVTLVEPTGSCPGLSVEICGPEPQS